jgi:hypothetical protein
VADWHSADDRNGREKIDRARQAAEALFRPAPRNADKEPPAATEKGASATEPQQQRQPRVFSAPPRRPVSAQTENPPESVQRKMPSRRRTTAVPSSQIGRIRTLATYGMTHEQVAELYGVTVDEIDRVLDSPVPSSTAR